MMLALLLVAAVAADFGLAKKTIVSTSVYIDRWALHQR